MTISLQRLSFLCFLVFALGIQGVSGQVVGSIAIEFTTKDTVGLMTGYKYGISSSTPSDSLIAPLKPRYWAGGNPTATSIYNRTTNSLHTSYIYTLSEQYGYPSPSWVAPYQDTLAYRSFIDSVCAQTVGKPVIYDIWNEPDTTASWTGSDTSFFRTFKRAHDRIRQNLGSGAVICGPSVRKLDTAYLRKFLNYCLAQNIKLDALSLHWVADDTLTHRLKDSLKLVRTMFVNNPVYAPLGIKKLLVNGIIEEEGQYRPAYILAHYYNLEQGKADGSCRTCWSANDGSGTSNCSNNTINGLLTPVTNQKRAVWWATKVYAELDSVRYRTYASNYRMFTMASRLAAHSDTLRLVVGHYHTKIPQGPGLASITMNYLHQVAGFPFGDSLDITIYKIPSTGVQPLAQPQFLSHYRTRNNANSVTLPTVPVDSNAVIYLDIVNIAAPTSIDGITKNEGNVTVYPNPATNDISIAAPDDCPCELRVVNANGQEVMKQKMNATTTVDVSTYPKGIYFLLLRAEKTGRTFTRKLLKL